MKFLFVVWALCAAVASAAGATSDMPTLDDADPPVVALFVEPGMRVNHALDYERRLVRVAAWSDGRVVWSHNLDEGGSPYFSGKVSPAKVDEVLAVATRTSATEHNRTDYRMPDASSTHIVMQGATPDTNFAMISAHPNYDSSKSIFTSKGLINRADIDHSAPVSKDEAEFRQFRKNFDLMMETILGVVPAENLKFR